MKKNYIYAFLCVLIWSTMGSVSKLVLEDVPSFQTLMISSLFAFLFLFGMNIVRRKIKMVLKYNIKDLSIMAGLGFVGIFLYTVLYYYGLSQLSFQIACILNYLWPVMIVLFSSLILKERLTWIKVVAMLCSFIGIVILSIGNESSSQTHTVLGMISCIVAAACYGLFSVLNKKYDYDQNISMMILWFVSMICSFVSGIMSETWVMLNGMQWLSLIWLGVFVNAIAYLLWAIALSHSDNTAKIANMAFLTPFLSLLVSVVLLNEMIEFKAIVALIFIVGGIVIQNILSQS